MTPDHETEETPLLTSRRGSETHSERRTGKQITSSQLTILIPCLILLIVIEMGGSLNSIPLNEIIETIICQNYHRDLDGGAQDPRCKDRDVQAELSFLLGWQGTLELIPGLLTAVPYGVAAERYGRRVVLALSILGIVSVQGFTAIICSFPSVFPIRMIWLSSTFSFIGGGPGVYSAMVFAIATDISPQEQRSTTFSYIGAAMLVGDLISSPLAYFAMQIGVWFSVFTGLGCLALSILIALSLPETSGRNSTVEDTEDSGHPSTDIPSSDGNELSAANGPPSSGLKQFIATARYLFWENRQLGLLLLSLLFTTLGRNAQVVLLQYITKRYGWSWSQAGLLLSVRSFTTLVLFLVLLPAVSQLLVAKLGLSPITRDLWLARISIALLAAGAFGIGLASVPALLVIGMGSLALGSGYNLIARGLLALAAKGRHIGVLYTSMNALEVAGSLVAGPLLAITFRAGLDLGGSWIGLPFIAAGLMFVCAAVILGSIRFKADNDTPEDGQNQDGTS